MKRSVGKAQAAIRFEGLGSREVKEKNKKEERKSFARSFGKKKRETF